MILTPTAGTIYEMARVDAEPVQTNSTLGYYTNFMNLLDLTGVAIPAGFRSDGLPFGVTIVGRSATDHALLALAGELQHAFVDVLGAVKWTLPEPTKSASATRESYIAVAVCGAHMDGLPLNPQLRDRGGYLVRSTQTAAKYRLFVLSGGRYNALARADEQWRDLGSGRSVGRTLGRTSLRLSRAFLRRLESAKSSFMTEKAFQGSYARHTPPKPP